MSEDVSFKQFWLGKDIQTHKTIFWGELFQESDFNFHINTHKHRGWREEEVVVVVGKRGEGRCHSY